MPYRVTSTAAPLLFVHTPKTGGTWVRTRLGQRYGRPEKVGRPHGHVRAVPLHMRDRSLTFGCVRDPWTWYASLWGHAMTLGDEGRHMCALWGEGSTEFRHVLYGITHPGRLEKHPRPFLVAQHEGGWPRDPSAPVWSEALRYWYRHNPTEGSGWAVDALISTHALPDALESLTGDQHDPAPVNTAAHTRSPSTGLDMYDDEMLGWVAEADADGIACLGAAPGKLAQRVYWLSDRWTA
jgi:hypothetical protein